MATATRNLAPFVLLKHGCGTGCVAATKIAAATATVHPYPEWLRVLIWLGFGFVLIVGYVIACVFWQWKPCRKCKGEGRFRSPSGKAWRHCPRCGGSRERLRIGRRVYNFYAKGSKHV